MEPAPSNTPNLGFFVRRIEVLGDGKEPATIDFKDGLNIVTGPSDTGKSYILQVLNYLLGAKNAPKENEASKGYDTFVGYFQSRKRNVGFKIQRGCIENCVWVDGEKLPLKKTNSLNELLLHEVNLENSKILKNKNGETKPLSSRDLVHLSIVDENRISKEGPPHVLGKPEVQPAEKAVVKRLLTDVNYDRLAVVPNKQIEKAKISLSVLKELKEQLQSRLNDEVVNSVDGIKMMKETTERKLQIVMPEVESHIATIEPQIVALKSKLKERQALQAKYESYQSSTSRFQSLDSLYSADMDRLQNLVSISKHYHKLENQPCPVCGEIMKGASEQTYSETTPGNDLEKAMMADLEETKALRQDLLSVMGNEQRYMREVETQIEKLDKEINVLFATISQLHSEFIKPSIGNIRDIVSELEHFSECQLIANQIDDYEHRIEEQKTIIDAQSDEYSPNLTIKEALSLTNNAIHILEKWGFDRAGIQFSDAEQDFTIDYSIRSSHGKGVRSLGCAAFLVALMKTCLDENRPHYSFVAIDSPLASYKRAEPEANRKGVPRGIQHTLYTGFCDLPGQIIVFDNTEVPSGLHAHVVKFTKNDSGRYGFFPRPSGKEA